MNELRWIKLNGC